MTKKVICIIFILLLMCGCVNNEIGLNIDSDGNVIFNNVIMFDEESYDVFIDTIDNDSDEFSINGYDVKRENENNNIKYIISRNLGNISKLSSRKNEEVNLSLYFSGKLNNLFIRKNYILFDKYISKINIDYSDGKGIEDLMSIFTNERMIGYEDYSDMISLLNNVNSKFVINTSYKIRNGNYDTNYDNEYVWNIDYDKNNEIYFELYMFNTDILIVLGIIIFIVLIISIIVSIRNKRLYKISKTSIVDSLKLEDKIMSKDIDKVNKNNINSRDVSALNNRGRN